MSVLHKKSIALLRKIAQNSNIIYHPVHDHYCTESLFGLLSSLEAKAEHFFSILD